MKIATYNINSIRARGDNLCKWLKSANPDIVFLQEIKCEVENFLYFECESLGYHVAVLGQKSYNGVAILSKYDFEITAKNIPSFQDDDASRYLEVLITHNNQQFYAISVYAPNGCSNDRDIEAQKMAYKLKWFDKLYERISYLKSSGKGIIIGGDFNVMLKEIDVFNPDRFKNSPLYRKEVWDKLIALQYLGLYDAFRLLYPKKEGFTFWDYSANSFVTNSGLRIDYLFISAMFTETLSDCFVDRQLREMEKPSDHTALIAEFGNKDE